MPPGDWHVEIAARLACDFVRFAELRSASFKSADSRLTRLRFKPWPCRSSEIGPSSTGVDNSVRGASPAPRRGADSLPWDERALCSRRFNHSLRC